MSGVLTNYQSSSLYTKCLNKKLRKELQSGKIESLKTQNYQPIKGLMNLIFNSIYPAVKFEMSALFWNSMMFLM